MKKLIFAALVVMALIQGGTAQAQDIQTIETERSVIKSLIGPWGIR